MASGYWLGCIALHESTRPHCQLIENVELCRSPCSELSPCMWLNWLLWFNDVLVVGLVRLMLRLVVFFQLWLAFLLCSLVLVRLQFSF